MFKNIARNKKKCPENISSVVEVSIVFFVKYVTNTTVTTAIVTTVTITTVKICVYILSQFDFFSFVTILFFEFGQNFSF